VTCGYDLNDISEFITYLLNILTCECAAYMLNTARNALLLTADP